MGEQKSLLYHLAEAYERYRAERRAARGAQESAGQSRWWHRLAHHPMPNAGTILVVIGLLWAQSAGALPVGASWQLAPTSESAACPYDFNDTPGVDLGDITLIAGTWRATDAASLATYDFNGNDKVDVGDIMTVVEHLGPCP